jgi:hypothetical protein
MFVVSSLRAGTRADRVSFAALGDQSCGPPTVPGDQGPRGRLVRRFGAICAVLCVLGLAYGATAGLAGFGDWRLYQVCCTLAGTRALITTPASSTSWNMTVQAACVAARSAAEDPAGNQLTVAYAQCFNGGEIDMNAACGANGDLFNLVEQLNGSTGNGVCTNVGNPGFNTTHKYTVDTTDPSGNNWVAYIDGMSTMIALTFSRHNAAVVGEGDENTGTCGIGTFMASSNFSTMQRWSGTSWITVQGADWEPTCSWTKNDGPPNPWTVSHS